MSGFWIRSVDGTSLVRTEEIVSVRADGELLMALVRADRSIALAQGDAEELSGAAEALAQLIQSTGQDDIVVSAVCHANGIEWAVSHDEGGSDSASVSTKAIDKESWERDRN
jgi:hypothetical protein